MRWLSEESVFTFGKYKGKRVSDVDDAQYIKWIHESHLEVFFTEDVFRRLGVKHSGLVAEKGVEVRKKYTHEGKHLSRVMAKADRDDAKWMKERRKKVSSNKKKKPNSK